MLACLQVCDQNSELSEKLRQAQQAVGQERSAQLSTLQQDLVAAKVHNDSLVRRMELQVGLSHSKGPVGRPLACRAHVTCCVGYELYKLYLYTRLF